MERPSKGPMRFMIGGFVATIVFAIYVNLPFVSALESVGWKTIIGLLLSALFGGAAAFLVDRQSSMEWLRTAKANVSDFLATAPWSKKRPENSRYVWPSIETVREKAADFGVSFLSMFVIFSGMVFSVMVLLLIMIYSFMYALPAEAVSPEGGSLAAIGRGIWGSVVISAFLGLLGGLGSALGFTFSGGASRKEMWLAMREMNIVAFAYRFFRILFREPWKMWDAVCSVPVIGVAPFIFGTLYYLVSNDFLSGFLNGMLFGILVALVISIGMSGILSPEESDMSEGDSDEAPAPETVEAQSGEEVQS